MPSIDNLTTNVKDVHSLFVVPVFGHRRVEEPNEDDDSFPILPDSASEGEEHSQTFGAKKNL